MARRVKPGDGGKAIAYDAKPKKRKKYNGEDVISEARDRYEAGWTWEEINYEKAADDLRFYADEQWPDDVRQERDKEGRPMLTINRIPQFVEQVSGDIRLNRPAIKVRPAGGDASFEIAELLTGLVRNIEVRSDAQTAYITAAENAATCGLGVFRVTTDYEDAESFDLEIKIKREPNSLKWIFDPDAKEITREDMRWCLGVERMTYDEFKRRYPDAQCASWDEARILGYGEFWFDVKDMAVAEYWRKVPVKRTIGLLEDGSVVEVTEADKRKVLRKREVSTFKVEQYIITGVEVLEGPIEWPCEYIPVIPVVGKEIYIQDRVVRRGIVRGAKDPQRMYNYHVSTAVEVHALAPKAPFVLTAEQVKGHENQWRNANRKNYPYLIYNGDKEANGPPQRQSASTDISTSLALSEQAVNDLHGTTGIYPPSLGQKSNESSGKAILARQRESDVGTYLYVDNLSKAIAYAGKIIVALIPKIYDTERAVRITGEDGTEDWATINQVDPVTGEITNNITVGKYDVVVETGPAFSTKREEAVTAMMELIRSAPNIAGLILDLLVKNMDWPNADKVVERLRAALPPGIDPEVDEERMQIQGPPQPDPMQEAQIGEQVGKARKANADADLAEIKAQTSQLDAERTIAETEGKQLDNALKSLELAAQTGEISELVRQEVTQMLLTISGRQPVQ